jgi:hypothetical protein
MITALKTPTLDLCQELHHCSAGYGRPAFLLQCDSIPQHMQTRDKSCEEVDRQVVYAPTFEPADRYLIDNSDKSSMIQRSSSAYGSSG